MARKCEWVKDLDAALSLNYVLEVDGRKTTLSFSAYDLREAMGHVGDQKAKQQLIDDVRNIVAMPNKGLVAEEQAAILNGLHNILTTFAA